MKETHSSQPWLLQASMSKDAKVEEVECFEDEGK